MQFWPVWTQLRSCGYTERMAAFWGQDVTGASGVCVVTEVVTEEPVGTSLKIPFPKCPFFPVHVN